MSAQLLLFASLALMMAQLGVALTIAWIKFGRAAHVALWAAGFYALAATYVAFSAGFAYPAALPLLLNAGGGFGIGCATLVALGFRFRSGKRTIAAVVTAGLVPSALLSTFAAPIDGNWFRIVPAVCGAVMFAMSAQALRAGPRPHEPATRATFWMLLAFSVFEAGCAVSAADTRLDSADASSLFQTIAFLGVPVGMTGLGLSMLLLVASDLAERLRRLAAFDALTGVLNRRGFEAAAKRVIAHGLRGGRALTLVVADLDRFKTINDRFGHSTGDAVLQCFARHCETMVRTGDVVGRLGGEEFVMLMPGASTRVAAEAMERLRAGLTAALEMRGLPATVTASFGIAGFAGRGDTLAEMLERADAALYGSKDDGRDRITFAPTEAMADPRFAMAFARA